MQYQSQTPEGTKLVHSGSAWLRTLIVTNVSAGTRYLYIFDGLTATGTLLFNPVAIASTDSIDMELDPKLIQFSTGLFVASSTTQATYTPGGASDLMIHAIVDAAFLKAIDCIRMVDE